MHQVYGGERARLQVLSLPLRFSGNCVGSNHPSKLLRGAFPTSVVNWPWSDPHHHILFSLIHKLMVSTISTGALTLVVAVIGLILFLTDSHTNGEHIWQYLTLLGMTDPHHCDWLQLRLDWAFASPESSLSLCSITWTIEVHWSMCRQISSMPTAPK